MDYSLPRAQRIAALGYDYGAEPKTAAKNCNLCGDDAFVQITHSDRYGYAAMATTCRRCGLTQLNPRPVAESYAHFYQSVYRPLVSAFHGRLIDAKTIQQEQAEYAVRLATLAAPFICRAARRNMLDVGGSTGIVASQFAKSFGLDALVIDPAPAEADVARKLGIRTQVGFIEQWETQERFDVIGMFQTVDHLLDVAETLRRLRQVIATGGIFIVDIVDFRAAYLRNWSVEQAIKIDHPYYLTQETMEAYLRVSGFRVLCTDYAPDHLHIAYVCEPADPIAVELLNLSHGEAQLREIRYVQNRPRSPG